MMSAGFTDVFFNATSLFFKGCFRHYVGIGQVHRSGVAFAAPMIRFVFQIFVADCLRYVINLVMPDVVIYSFQSLLYQLILSQVGGFVAFSHFRKVIAFCRATWAIPKAVQPLFIFPSDQPERQREKHSLEPAGRHSQLPTVVLLLIGHFAKKFVKLLQSTVAGFPQYEAHVSVEAKEHLPAGHHTLIAKLDKYTA